MTDVQSFSYWGPASNWWEWLAAVLLLAFILARTVGSWRKTRRAWWRTIALWLFIASIVVGPFFTAHQLVGNELVLRQGWHFLAKLTVEDIVSVRPIQGFAFVGVRTNPGSERVWVITGARNMVLIELSEPAPARLLGVPLYGRSRFIINLADPDHFLAVMSEHIAD